MLLFKIKLRKHIYLPWFLLSIWPIPSFFRRFQVFFPAFYRRSQGWTLLFQKTWTARPFYHRNLSPRSIFPAKAKKDSPLVSFSVGLEKSSNFPLQFQRFLPHYWRFQLSDALATALATAPA